MKHIFGKHKSARLLAAAFIGTALMSAEVPAITNGYVVMTDQVNVRQLPSVNSNIVTVLDEGDPVLVTFGPSDGWYEIYMNNSCFYVKDDYIVLEGQVGFAEYYYFQHGVTYPGPALKATGSASSSVPSVSSSLSGTGTSAYSTSSLSSVSSSEDDRSYSSYSNSSSSSSDTSYSSSDYSDTSYSSSDYSDTSYSSSSSSDTSYSSSDYSSSYDDSGASDYTGSSSSSQSGTYLGNFKLTAYCHCAICNGVAGNPTASGVMPTTGHTVAMGGIPFGTQLLINGTVYTVEDRGTPYGHVDIFVGSHDEALQFGVQYADVYQLN